MAKSKSWGWNGYTRSTTGGFISWDVSPRDSSGKLLRKSNAHFKWRSNLSPSGSTFAQYQWNSTGLGNYPTYCWASQCPLAVLKSRCSEAYSMAYKSFRDQAWQQAEMLLAVDIAERKKTYAMIAKSFQRIWALARAIARFDPRALGRALSEMGAPRDPRQIRRDLYQARRRSKKRGAKVEFENLWLEYRYGWLPLLGSINSACELLSSPRKAPDFLSGFGKGTYAGWTTDMANHSAMKFYVTADLHVIIKGRLNVSNPDLHRLNQYGLLNPALVAWELVPFSFVIDWFVKVGDYLGSLSDWAGMSFNDLSVTYHASGTTLAKSKGNNPAYYGPVDTLILTSTGLRKNRELTGTPPIPELQLGSGYKVQRDKWTAEKRAADTIALFSTIALRR